MRLTFHVVFLVLVGNTMAFSVTCREKHYYDETLGKCSRCRPCLLNSSYTYDGASFMNACWQGNNDTLYEKNGMEIGLWCDRKSRVVAELQNPSTPPTTRSTSTLNSASKSSVPGLPTTSFSTTGGLGTRALSSSSTSAPLETGGIGLGTTITLSIFIPLALICLIGIGIILKYLKGRRLTGSDCSSRVLQIDATIEEEEANKPMIIIMDTPEQQPRRRTERERPRGADARSPVSITVTPGHVVHEDTKIVISVYHPWSDCHVVWKHEETGLVYFGLFVEIEKAKEWHSGSYTAAFVCRGSRVHKETVRIRVTKRDGSNQRPNELNNNPRAVESIDNSPIQYAEASDLAVLPRTEESCGRLFYTNPSTDDRPLLVPSAQSAPNLLRDTLNVMLANETSSYVVGAPGCTLRIMHLLNNEDAMMQLAILFDPTHILRAFAAVKGDMTVPQIDYVWYITRGSGNTVKGLFEYIIRNKDLRYLTASDFLRFMVDRNWPCERVIHLLHVLHPDCSDCSRLYREYHSGEGNDAISHQKPPGFSYHVTNRFAHCNQSLKSLARDQVYSEEFQQKGQEYFETDTELWRAIGSHLGGMTTDLLDHINHHNGLQNKSRYRAMLDKLVAIYPDLKVATFVQWLYDHDHKSAAQFVLKYHRHCDCCRQF